MTDFTGHAPERETDEREALIGVIRALDHPRIPTLAATEYAKIADAVLAAGYTRPSPRAPSGSPAEVPPNWKADPKVQEARRDVEMCIEAEGLVAPMRHISDSERSMLDALCAAVWRSAQQ